MTLFVSKPDASTVDAPLRAVVVAARLNELVSAFRFAAMRDPRTESAFMVARDRYTGRCILLCPAHPIAELLAWLPALLAGADCSARVSDVN